MISSDKKELRLNCLLFAKGTLLLQMDLTIVLNVFCLSSFFNIPYLHYVLISSVEKDWCSLIDFVVW